MVSPSYSSAILGPFLSNFLVEISSFPLFLCIDHLGRLSCLSLFFATLHSDRYIFPFLFSFHFSCFLSYLLGLLRQPFCPFAFLLGDGFGHLLLYNVVNLCPLFFRHSIRSNLLTICPFHCVIVRDSIVPEWSSDFPYFLQFKSEFCNKEFMI